jgi:hypothetical protein
LPDSDHFEINIDEKQLNELINISRAFALENKQECVMGIRKFEAYVSFYSSEIGEARIALSRSLSKESMPEIALNMDLIRSVFAKTRSSLSLKVFAPESLVFINSGQLNILSSIRII